MDEHKWKDALEDAAEDLQSLSLTLDSLILGLKQERVETQVLGCLKAVQMCVGCVQKNVENALKTEI